MSRTKFDPPGVREHIEHSAARVFGGVFSLLPLPLAACLGRCIGETFFRLDRRHRERAQRQILMAYQGEMDEARAGAVARGMYHHLGTMLAEFVRQPRIQSDTVDDYIDWGGHLEQIDVLRREHGGVIYATGHFGNWEMGGYAFHAKGLTSGAIARPLDNPLIDRYVRSIREAGGQEIWDKMGALRRVVRVLRDGGSFGILVDQDAGKRGVFVPFFGIESSTIPTVADLALRTRAPVVVAAMHRGARPMQFRFRMCEPILPDTTGSKEDQRLSILQRVNDGVEALIRKEPSQWLWLHRRWKTRPRGEG